MTPIAKWENGQLWLMTGGRYYPDLFGFDSIFRLDALKSLPEEYRTQQDRESIKALETAFKARRAAEEEKE